MKVYRAERNSIPQLVKEVNSEEEAQEIISENKNRDKMIEHNGLFYTTSLEEAWRIFTGYVPVIKQKEKEKVIVNFFGFSKIF
jgi:hypothetical protein